MSQYSIFLVDDDEDDIYLARLTFNEHFPDWKMTSFGDGQELIDYLLANTTQALPDLLILDLNMPRKNGFECLSEIKLSETLKQLPVIVFSTSFEQEVVNLLYKNGAQHFIRNALGSKKLNKKKRRFNYS